MAASSLEQAAHGSGPGKYLTFILGGGGYGIPILKVREIIRLLEITPIPRMPDYVRGIINLRGKIVPVIDLRLKFALPDITTTNRTCIIVTYVMMGAVSKLMGVIVDALDEVDLIGADDIEPAPDFGTGTATSYISSVARSKGRVKALLNIDAIVQDDRAILPLPEMAAAENPPR